MHELGVVFHIMDNLEKVAKENKAEGISKVVLELGEVSTVIESYLQTAGNGRLRSGNCSKERSWW